MGIHSFWHLYATEPFIETETFMFYYGIATFPKIEMLFPVLICTFDNSTMLTGIVLFYLSNDFLQP